MRSSVTVYFLVSFVSYLYRDGGYEPRPRHKHFIVNLIVLTIVAILLKCHVKSIQKLISMK